MGCGYLPYQTRTQVLRVEYPLPKLGVAYLINLNTYKVMERFKIINAQRVDSSKAKKNVDGTFDYYQLTLEDSKGQILIHPDSKNEFTVAMSTKHVHSLLEQKQVQVNILMPSEVQALIDTGSLMATIDFKKAGDEFVATENTKLITLDNGKTWIEPKAGESYEVQETGYRVDYDKSVVINFDINLATKFERGAMLFAMQNAQ